MYVEWRSIQPGRFEFKICSYLYISNVRIWNPGTCKWMALEGTWDKMYEKHMVHIRVFIFTVMKIHVPAKCVSTRGWAYYISWIGRCVVLLLCRHYLLRVMRKSEKKISPFWASTFWYNQIVGAIAAPPPPPPPPPPPHTHTHALSWNKAGDETWHSS